MKVAELRGELQKLGLPTTGRKEELQTRLLEAMDKGDGGEESAPAPATTGPRPAPTSPHPSGVPTTVAKSPASPVNGVPASVPASAPLKPSSTAATSQQLAERAARFNLPPTEADRKRQRQERFGAAEGVPSTQPSVPPPSKRLGVSAGDREAILAEERLRARQERFGVVSHSRLETIEAAAQLARRQERFGSDGHK